MINYIIEGFNVEMEKIAFNYFKGISSFARKSPIATQAPKVLSELKGAGIHENHPAFQTAAKILKKHRDKGTFGEAFKQVTDILRSGTPNTVGNLVK